MKVNINKEILCARIVQNAKIERADGEYIASGNLFCPDPVCTIPQQQQPLIQRRGDTQVQALRNFREACGSTPCLRNKSRFLT
jgi:hypothetical protein